MSDKGPLLTNYQQWQMYDKKLRFSLLLQSQLNGFLVHHNIKRMQVAYFAKLIIKCSESSIVLQVHFPKNASLLQQNEIQAAHWTYQ